MTSVRLTLDSPAQLTLFTAESWSTATSKLGSTFSQAASTPEPQSRKDVFKSHLLKGVTLIRPYDIPRIEACTDVPDRLISFSEAMLLRKPDFGAWVHWFEDDYKYERVWLHYERYRARLKGFAGVISPDFSLYRNLPVALKIQNTYRNQLLGARMQIDGMKVIANTRLSEPASIPYALAGIPFESTLAIGLHGCTKSTENRPRVLQEIRLITDLCRPKNFVVYGSDAYGVLDYPQEQGVKVHLFRPDTWKRSVSRGVA